MKKTASNKPARNAGKSAAKIARALRSKSRPRAFKLGVGLTGQRDGPQRNNMTVEEKLAAALADPDAQPITEEREAKMRRTPQVSVIRRALKLSQEEFAERFAIPIGTLRDWEQERKEPDTAARAYLMVIASIPEAVSEALAKRRRVLAKLKPELD
jgi:putative transcriptional regulator